MLTEHGVPIAPRTFYAWVVRAPSKRSLWDATITAILAGYYEPDENGRRKPESLYGSLKMWAHLNREGIPVAVCGEMASDPLLLRLLIGCGLTEFSMTPGAIPIVRQVVQELHAEDARRLASHALRLATAAEIEEYLFDALAASAIQRSQSS